MTQTILILVAVALVLMVALTAGLMAHLTREDRMQARVKAIRAEGYATFVRDRRPTQINVAVVIGAFGSMIARSGLLSRKTVHGLEQTLAAAGMRSGASLGIFVGCKLLLLVLAPLIMMLVLQHFSLSPLFHNVAIAAAAMVGLLAPDWYVGHRHKKYIDSVAVGLPDALDMMVICAEAGLSFEPAITRVAAEIRHAHVAVADEFNQTAQELRVVADTRVALLNMGGRTGLDSLRRMGSMLAQTMQYGTPLGEALRVLSAEMRHETLMRYETRAARLPVLMTIPMIIFILPCIFMIVGGPAAIQVIRSMSK